MAKYGTDTDRRIEHRPFSNRYVFARVMQENPDLCREIIERVLGIEIGRIEVIEVESEMTSIERRGVRFDVYLRNSDAAFEVEMQTYDQNELPLRMRYYRAMLDRRLLGKGAPFDALRPVYIIFICKDDPCKRGLPVYTFRSMCEEDPTVPFDNGAVDVVLSARGDLSKTSPEIAALLRYVATDEPTDDLTNRLRDAVDYAHEDEGWVKSVDMLEWDIRDAKRAAEKEGLTKGMAEGMAKGMAEGIAEGMAEGMAKGMAEGMAKGMTEGRAEGRAEGMTEGKAEGRAEGISAERKRQADLIEAMRADGRAPDEILAALTADDVDELCERYGIESITG